MVLVSACLTGEPYRYNGTHAYLSLAAELFREKAAVSCCPETAAGFPTPREPFERSGEQVLTESGKDVTRELMNGMSLILQELDSQTITCALLKECSPTCGVHWIYDGTFTKKLIPGCGLFTEQLIKREIPVYSDQQLGSSAVYNDLIRCLR